MNDLTDAGRLDAVKQMIDVESAKQMLNLPAPTPPMVTIPRHEQISNFTHAVQALLDRGDIPRVAADDMLMEQDAKGYGDWERLFNALPDLLRPVEPVRDWYCGPMW